MLVESGWLPQPVLTWSTQSLLPEERVSSTFIRLLNKLQLCVFVWALKHAFVMSFCSSFPSLSSLVVPRFSSPTSEWKECPEYIHSNRECFFDVNHTSVWITYCMQLRSQNITFFNEGDCFTVENIGEWRTIVVICPMSVKVPSHQAHATTKLDLKSQKDKDFYQVQIPF